MTDDSPPADELEKARRADEALGDGEALELAVRKLLYGLAGDDVDPDDCGYVEATRRALHNVSVLEAENERLRDEVGHLQAQVDMLTDERDTKEGKIRSIVTAARNQRRGDYPIVLLTARDIVTATGVSQRYAYDLIDSLPTEYTWIMTRQEARTSQYGHLEIDGDEQTRAIGIHFERLQSDPVALNKFNNGGRGEDPET